MIDDSFAEYAVINIVTQNYENKDIQNNEYPAGMGLFSLANRDCKIEVNEQLIALEPEHFTGKKLVEICETAFNQGTRISFPLLNTEIMINSPKPC